METQSTVDLLNEIRAGLDELELLLPAQLLASEVSPVAKVPFNVLTCRSVLGWRFVELSRSALQCLDQDRIASSVVLTRAALETGAAVWYLHTKVIKALDTAVLGDIGDQVLRILLGSRTTPEAPPAFNVLNFVDAVDKQIAGVRSQYDALSEFAHPNWAGALYLYGKDDLETRSCSFGPDAAAVDNVKVRAATVLSGTAFIFRHVFDEIIRLSPAFVDLCEQELASRSNQRMEPTRT